MKIEDNIIRNGLKNVYFINGTAYGGKSTIADIIAKELDIIVYHLDDCYGEYAKVANIHNQPAFCKKFEGWDNYFNREPKIYSKWLRQSAEECAEFAIMDLLRMAQDRKVIAEGYFPVDWMKRLVSGNQCAFLIAEYNTMKAGFFDREDKKDMYECIMNQNQPMKTMNNVIEALMYDYYDFFEEVKNSGFQYFERCFQTNHEELKNKVISCLDL